MAKEGDQKDAKEEKKTDPDRNYQEEKLKMSSNKALMTKKIAKEVVDCRNDVKKAYNRIESTNEQLTKKLIVLDRTGKVPDVESSCLNSLMRWKNTGK